MSQALKKKQWKAIMDMNIPLRKILDYRKSINEIIIIIDIN